MVDLTCPQCAVPFSRQIKTINQARKLGRRIFCSIKCCGLSLLRRSVIVCSQCGSESSKTPSQLEKSARSIESKGHYFCSTRCSSIFRNKLRVGPKHPSFTGGSYRKGMATQCCDCGEDRYYLLQVHHIDGNRKNPDPSNHETVCANCHVKRHLKISANGRWKMNFKVLTPRDLLSKM
jgi:hypothetical protein